MEDFQAQIEALRSQVASINQKISEPVPRAKTPPAPPTTTPPTSTGGAFYFEPVVILDATTAIIDWTTLDLAQYEVESGAKEVIFDADYDLDLPDVGPFPYLLVRRDSSQQTPYYLSKGRSSGGADQIGGANQARFPITSSRTVDYSLTVGFNIGYTLRLIGYVL